MSYRVGTIMSIGMFEEAVFPFRAQRMRMPDAIASIDPLMLPHRGGAAILGSERPAGYCGIDYHTPACEAKQP